VGAEGWEVEEGTEGREGKRSEGNESKGKGRED